MKGLAANVGGTELPETTASAEQKADGSHPSSNPEESQSPPNAEREDDWGLAPASSGISRETKMGFAFVFVLLVVFGFVVHKKLEHNRALRGDLLASVQGENPSDSETHPANSAENPIVDNAFPPDPNGNLFHEPQQPAPADYSPASWNNQESFEPSPHQELASNSSTSLDPFPPEPEFETPATPQNQNMTPFPENEFAQAPAPEGFEPPTEFANQNEFSEPQSPAAPATGKTGDDDFNPFDGESLPAQPASAEAPVDFEDEQFSAQSEPVPQEPPSQEPVTNSSGGHPFGDFPGSQSGEPTPTVSNPPETSAGDPFAVTPSVEYTPESAELVEGNPGTDFSGSPGQTPPQSLPAQAAPEEFSSEDDPRFGDFQPAPTGNQYEPDPAEPTIVQHSGNAVPNELPSDLFAQAACTEAALKSSGTLGQMQPNDRPGVYIVRPGDNYWNISKRQYGTVRYFMALARYNQHRIPDPNKMRPGMKVLTPTREVMEARNPDLFPKFAANAAGVSNVAHRTGEKAGFYMDANGAPMYRVGPDDTLGGIAQKHLGRFSRWVEIYQLNRHRLKDPNALTLGDVLQLPADASQVNMVRHASGIR